MNDKAAEVIKHLADKLDLPVQQLWQGLVGYAPFVYAQWEAVLLVSIVVFVVTGIAFVVSLYKTREEELPWGPVAVISAVVAMFSGVSIAVSLGEVAYALAAKHAPEAWAAKYVIQRLK